MLSAENACICDSEFCPREIVKSNGPIARNNNVDFFLYSAHFNLYHPPPVHRQNPNCLSLAVLLGPIHASVSKPELMKSSSKKNLTKLNQIKENKATFVIRGSF